MRGGSISKTAYEQDDEQSIGSRMLTVEVSPPNSFKKKLSPLTAWEKTVIYRVDL